MTLNNEESSRTMRVIRDASQEYTEQTPLVEHSQVGLGYYISDTEVLVRAMRRVYPSDSYGRVIDTQTHVESEIKRGAIDIGKRQQYGLLNAAMIIAGEKSPDEVSDILRQSHALGNLFGQIADRPHAYFDLVDGKTNSELVVLDIVNDPERFLDYVPGSHVRYSKEGISRIRPLLQKGMGCPALKQVIELAGAKTTTFAASWAANTEDFIVEHVTTGILYVYDSDDEDD